MNPINLLLVEDNQDSVEILKYFLQGLEGFKLVGICNNGDQLVEEVMQKKPDLVLTDINMPKKNGMDAIKECLTFYPNLKFIFITGYDEYAIEAFRLAALDYIVKPVEKERLYKALNKAKTLRYFEENIKIEQAPTENIFKKLPIKDQNYTRYIPFADIYFIEKVAKKCLVHTQSGIFETNDTIGKLLDRLDDSFFPSHRAFIINLNKVHNITPLNETYFVFFRDYGKQASISKLKINEIRDKISN